MRGISGAYQEPWFFSVACIRTRLRGGEAKGFLQNTDTHHPQSRTAWLFLGAQDRPSHHIKHHLHHPRIERTHARPGTQSRVLPHGESQGPARFLCSER